MTELFSKDQIVKAKSIIKNSLPDKDVSNGVLFHPFSNATVTKDFTRKSLKRINVLSAHFFDCKFIGVAATGSKFYDTDFCNCNFKGSNFQFCQFNKVRFKDSSIIIGANFSHSIFIECEFHDITITESTLYDCHFENCNLSASIIKTNTLENTIMRNCLIENIDLAHINLEYMKFDKNIMKNVILPPYQVPYIIGAPTYIKNTDDSISIYTDNGTISIKEYCNMYREFEAYFYGQKNYFPLANMLIADQKYPDAFDCIRLGIEEACDYFDFRMIKHYCRLACSCDKFTAQQLKTLYDLVTDLSYDNTWDINTLHFYMINIGEIREILLNNYENKQRIEFIIKTNIDKDDLISINSLYNQINEIIKENCSISHIDSIELRHNSPYELLVTCIDNLPNILLFLSAMYSLFVVGNKGIDFLKNIEETIRLHQQNKLFKYELEEKQLDIELKKKELNKEKRDNSIITYPVVEVEHILKCNSIEIAKNLNMEYLHYKISNSRK